MDRDETRENVKGSWVLCHSKHKVNTFSFKFYVILSTKLTRLRILKRRAYVFVDSYCVSFFSKKKKWEKNKSTLIISVVRQDRKSCKSENVKEVRRGSQVTIRKVKISVTLLDLLFAKYYPQILFGINFW